MARHIAQLHYGTGAVISLDLPAEALLAEFTGARCTPHEDPAAAVAVALEHPLEFPPLKSAIFPGDKVAIAVDRDVPQSNLILAGVLHVLLRAGCDPHDISVVFASGTEGDNLNRIPEALRGQVRVEVHDPADKAGLMFLASSKSQHPIYFHRTLGEADVVLPISTLRLSGSFDYFGTHAGLFPVFSDEATQRRFRERSSKRDNRSQRRSEANEAAWLLGVQFTVQVTPGPNGTVLHVTAGETHAVARHAKQLCELAWLCRIPRRASLVVASIDGDDQQTWENWGRALYAASRAVDDQGAIVLCTDLREPPGPALRHLARIYGMASETFESDDFEPTNLESDQSDTDRSDGSQSEHSNVALKRPRHAHDALLARLLRRIRRRSRIYLLSGLDEDLVQGLGMAYVSSPRDINTLSKRHASCIVLENAHIAVPVEK